MLSAQHRLVGFFPDTAGPDWYMAGFGEELDDLGNSVAVHQRETGAGECLVPFAALVWAVNGPLTPPMYRREPPAGGAMEH